ncbi:MAG: FMN-binding negative transcriptional regulator [Acidobacteria bacterium]|nr:FMN-binding negative transcriptional regulator [Acidobacteriota bacterium]
MPHTRRDLAALFALAGVDLAAQQEPSGSLYIPKAHNIADRKLLHDFMDEFAFVDLVTAAPDIRITHIPVWLDRVAGKFGVLHGHVSRQNPQHKLFDGKQSAVIVFRGPHAYISPTWYAKPGTVPTWNFAVVHATGKPRAVTEKAAFKNLLAKLIAKFEKSGYDFSNVPPGVIDGMMQGIVGFEMEIDLLEGKFKLGQERNEPDRASLLEHLKTAKVDRSIYSLTEEFYRAKL